MKPSAAEKAFVEVVPKIVATVIPEFAPTLTKGESWAFDAESQSVGIRIGYNYNHVRVQLRPQREELRTEYGFVELRDALGALAPSLTESERYPKLAASSSQVEPEAERQLYQMLAFCRPIVEGDPDAWTRVRDFLQDQRSFRKQHQGESEVDFVFRVRNAALAAFRKEEYWTAFDLLVTIDIHSKLTREDRRMLKEAEKHVYWMR